MVKNRESVTTNGRAVFYASIWNDLRQAALDCGWALGLHGSLASDMDIMAMPWTEDAVHPLEMILALKRCFDNPKHIQLTETPMLNNRMVYTLSIWADFYLDINIIQPKEDEWIDCSYCSKSVKPTYDNELKQYICPSCSAYIIKPNK